MKTNIVNLLNEVVGEISLNDYIFACEPQKDLIYKVIHWQLAKRRLGTHQVKERGDVAGSTRKIRAQKGTGGARHGAIRGAQFRGGGIIFGPHYRDHGYKLNKKLRNLALRHSLSSVFQNTNLIILNDVNVTSAKTKDFIKNFTVCSLDSVLIIDSTINEGLRNSVSNLHGVDVLPVAGLNVYDIISHQKIIVTVEAMNKIEERLI